MRTQESKGSREEKAPQLARSWALLVEIQWVTNLTVTHEEKNGLGTLFREQTIYKHSVSLSSFDVSGKLTQ